MRNNKKKNTASNKSYWLIGRHAVVAAIQNANRSIQRIIVDEKHRNEYKSLLSDRNEKIQYLKTQEFEQIIRESNRDRVPHQGIAAMVDELDGIDLKEFINIIKAESKCIILALDQVTDPHNFGAILRSAAAFGVKYVMLPKNNSVKENSTVAKTSCGALDIVNLVYVTNLSQALMDLSEINCWILGLDGRAKETVEYASRYDKKVLVLGSEGEGMRRLTQEACDLMLKIPISDYMESLNVSNAAAVALYAITFCK